MRIACVLKSGGVYGPSYVRHIQRQVARHLTVPHEFLCLTDMVVDCPSIPLTQGYPGWWSKLELFRLDGPTIFFDLDTFLPVNLDGFAARVETALESADLLMLRDFNPRHGWASGVMAWNKRLPLTKISPLDMKRYSWDQKFIQSEAMRHGLKIAPLPGNIVSYKYHCKAGIPAGAEIVCFHGKPKPHEVGGAWWEGDL